jgi:chain length determinant protein EpsF
MSLTQLLIVLRARWISFVLVLTCAGALAVVANALLPKRYSATASVVLDVKSPDPIAGVVLPGANASGYMATQADVFRSERVALRAIRAMGLDKDPNLQQVWREATLGAGDYNAWLAELLLAGLDVRPGRESNVLAVTYTAKSPKQAATVANAFVAAYVGTTLDLRVEPAKQYSSFFDDRLKQARDALEVAQGKLSAYQQKKGLMATDERLDVENGRLTELTSQLVALQAIANESAGREGQMGGNPNQMSEVLNNGLVSSLKGDLARQEARLDEMSAKFGDQHPQVLEAKASIAQLRQKIDSETRRISGSVTANNTVNQQRLGQLRASVEEQRSKMMMLKGMRDEAAVLVRDVENAQRAYDAVSARMNQTSMESQTTQTNVSVLKNASLPLEPSSPRTKINLAIAMVVGTLLALATVIVRETLDQRLRTEDDVINFLKQPLLGALPVHNRTRPNGRLRLGLSKVGMFGGGGVPRLAK